jgi:hypothetical protein
MLLSEARSHGLGYTSPKASSPQAWRAAGDVSRLSWCRWWCRCRHQGGRARERAFYLSSDALHEYLSVVPSRVHGAWKTCGSMLAALDVHPRVARQILRHSKSAITMEIYEVPPAATRARELERRLGPRARPLLHLLLHRIGNSWSCVRKLATASPVTESNRRPSPYLRVPIGLLTRDFAGRPGQTLHFSPVERGSRQFAPDAISQFPPNR